MIKEGGKGVGQVRKGRDTSKGYGIQPEMVFQGQFWKICEAK